MEELLWMIVIWSNRMKYFEFGKENQKTMVLLHGGGACYREVMAKLKESGYVSDNVMKSKWHIRETSIQLQKPQRWVNTSVL